MNISLMHLETAPERCPMCDGELYVTQSEPRAGAACPICRGPLWFLQKKVDDVLILTILSEGKNKNTTSCWSDATFWSLKNATQAVVNLSRLPTVSSVFLDTLVAIQQKLKSAGGALKVCGLNPQVTNTFKDAELDSLFEIYPDEEAAQDSFDPSGDPSSMILPMLSEPVAESGKLAAQA
jgi:stage II sporulation protein AA (anti-sigma F factor antagonist)